MNAGLMADLPSLAGSGAEGVGLFRTELQFLVRNQMPKRSELSALYSRVLDAAQAEQARAEAAERDAVTDLGLARQRLDATWGVKQQRSAQP